MNSNDKDLGHGLKNNLPEGKAEKFHCSGDLVHKTLKAKELGFLAENITPHPCTT